MTRRFSPLRRLIAPAVLLAAFGIASGSLAGLTSADAKLWFKNKLFASVQDPAQAREQLTSREKDEILRRERFEAQQNGEDLNRSAIVLNPMASPNDNCAGAEVIPASGPFPHLTSIVNIAGNTNTGDPTARSCGGTVGTNGLFSSWYVFTPTTTGFYRLTNSASSQLPTDSTAGFFAPAPTFTSHNVSASFPIDTIMAIYTSAGGCAGPFTQVAGGVSCDDDSGSAAQSQIIPSLTGGTTYYVLAWTRDATPVPVSPYTGMQLYVEPVTSSTGTPTNDLCSGALPLTLNVMMPGTTFAAQEDYNVATTDPGWGPVADGNFPDTLNAGRDLVYSFTAPSAGDYTFTLTNATGEAVNSPNPAIYLSSSCPSAPPDQLVTLATGGTSAANRTAGGGSTSAAERISCFPMASGQTVFVFVDATSSIASGFYLQVTQCPNKEGEATTGANDTRATATTLSCGIEGKLASSTDVDYYTLPATTGRVFAMVNGAAAPSGSTNLRVVTSAPDTLENDSGDNTGQFGGSWGNVAGTPLNGASAFLRLSGSSVGPYQIYSIVRPTASETAETGADNDTFTGTTVQTGNYFSGVLSASTDIDVYRFTATAGDTIYVALDSDPTRTANPFNGFLELMDANGNLLDRSADGGGTSALCSSCTGTDTAATPNSPGEGMLFVARYTGDYFMRVGQTSGFAGSGGDYLVSAATFNCNAAACPAAANAGPDQTLCVTSPATLAANAPSTGTGTWSVVTGPSMATSQFGNVNVNNTTFTPAGGAGAYTLRWTITAPSCPTTTDDVVITFVASPTTSNAGPDQTICITPGTATLAANLPGIGTGTWSVVTAPGGGSTASSQFGNVNVNNTTFTASPAVAGAYTLRWTITNAPCPPSTDDVVITINAQPTTSNAGPDQTICGSQTATLAANAPASGTGTWSVVTGPSMLSSQFTNVNVNNTTFTPAGGAGAYTLRWTIANAPCTASTDDVTVTVTAGPPPANAGPDQTICITPGSATLAANLASPGSGTWSVVSAPGGGSTASSQFGNVTVNNTTFTASPAVAGAYTLRWTITGAPCPPSTDDVVITINAAPTASNAGADQTICVTGTTLGANAPAVGSGTWSVVTGPSMSTGQFASTTNPTTTFTPAGGAGTYTLRWTISNSPCTASTDDVVLTVRALPTTSNAGPDQTICVTTASTTLAANGPSIGTGTWSVVSGPSMASAQFGNTAVNNTSFTPAGGTGTYTLRWTISNAPCTASTDDVLVTVVPTPTTANAGPDQTICAGAATLAANTPAVGSGSWSVVSGPNMGTSQFNNTAAPNATFTPAGGAGTYTLRWTIANAPCTASTDDMVLTVQASCGELSVAFVADTLNNRVQKFDGTTWTVVVGNGVPGIAANQCNSPEAVAVSSDLTRIYVADTGANRITFSTNGGASWAVFASGPGIGLNQVNAPQGLAVDSAGNLYVSDTGNRRVLRFNGGLPGLGIALATDGFVGGQVKSPRGLAIDGAFNLYIADRDSNRIVKIAGANVAAVANTGTTLASGGIGLNQVSLPQGVAVSSAGDLYVADTGNNRVLMFTGGLPGPATVMTTGMGLSLGNVRNPEGVTVSAFTTGAFAGGSSLLVSDTGNNRIEGKLLPGGAWQLVGAPNSLGSLPGQFRSNSQMR